MRRLLTRFAVLGTMMGLLAACGAPVTEAGLQFSMSPSGTLGYEVDQSGTITIIGRNLRFRNTAGGHGVTITRFDIEYFTQDGSPIPAGNNSQENAVSLFVPPGIQCLEPDPFTGCTMGMEDWRFAPGPEAISEQSYQLLAVRVAVEHLAAGSPMGWYADITFSGFTATGGAFSTQSYRLAISPPD